MNIQTQYDSVNMCGKKPKSQNFRRLKQKILDVLPNATIRDDARRLNKWKKLDNDITHPAKNRLIMGATALITQPTIDYYNHNVDTETREVSRIRTVAKILAGTTVGMAVRGACFKLVEKMTNLKGNKKLLPAEFMNDFAKYSVQLQNHRNALSTGLAILAMCITNFLIDAPLTVFLTNHFNDKRLLKKQEAERMVNDG